MRCNDAAHFPLRLLSNPLSTVIRLLLPLCSLCSISILPSTRLLLAFKNCNCFLFSFLRAMQQQGRGRGKQRSQHPSTSHFSLAGNFPPTTSSSFTAAAVVTLPSPTTNTNDTAAHQSQLVNRRLFPLQAALPALPAEPASPLLDINSRTRLDSVRGSQQFQTARRRRDLSSVALHIPLRPSALLVEHSSQLLFEDADWLENPIETPTPSPPSIPLLRAHPSVPTQSYLGWQLQHTNRSVFATLATAVHDTDPGPHIRRSFHSPAVHILHSATAHPATPISSTSPFSPLTPTFDSDIPLLPAFESPSSSDSFLSSQSSSSSASWTPHPSFDDTTAWEPVEYIPFDLHNQQPSESAESDSFTRNQLAAKSSSSADKRISGAGIFQPLVASATDALAVFHKTHSSMQSSELNPAATKPDGDSLPSAVDSSFLHNIATLNTAMLTDQPSTTAPLSPPQLHQPESTSPSTAAIPSTTPSAVSQLVTSPSSISMAVVAEATTSPTETAASSIAAVDQQSAGSTDLTASSIAAVDQQSADLIQTAVASIAAVHQQSAGSIQPAASPISTTDRSPELPAQSVVNEATMQQFINDIPWMKEDKWREELFQLVLTLPRPPDTLVPHIHLALPLPACSSVLQQESSEPSRYIYLVSWDDMFVSLEHWDMNNFDGQSFGVLYAIQIEVAMSKAGVLRTVSNVLDLFHAEVDISYVLPQVQQWLIQKLEPLVGAALSLNGRTDVSLERKYCVGECAGSYACLQWQTIDIYRHEDKHAAFVRPYDATQDGSRVMLVFIPGIPIRHYLQTLASTAHNKVVSSATLERLPELVVHWQGRSVAQRAARLQVDSSWPIVEPALPASDITKRGTVCVSGSKLSRAWMAIVARNISQDIISSQLEELDNKFKKVELQPFPAFQPGDDTALSGTHTFNITLLLSSSIRAVFLTTHCSGNVSVCISFLWSMLRAMYCNSDEITLVDERNKMMAIMFCALFKRWSASLAAQSRTQSSTVSMKTDRMLCCMICSPVSLTREDGLLRQ